MAPTDYLFADTTEGALINGDVGWTLPWRFAKCFGALQRPATFSLTDGAPTGDGCWTPGAESANGGACTKRLDSIMRRSGSPGFRRSWPCHVDKERPRPPWASFAGAIERRGGGTRLARWMQDFDYKLTAGGGRVVWPWLCPKPVIVQRFAGTRDRPLCEFLRARDDAAATPALACDQVRGPA